LTIIVNHSGNFLCQKKLENNEEVEGYQNLNVNRSRLSLAFSIH